MEPLVRLRRLGRRVYRRLPGRPLHGALVGLDRWWRRRRGGSTVVARRGGIVWELQLDQMIDSALYHDGVFEPATVAACERLVRPGMIALDVGANVGAHALRLAALVGPRGRVWAVEPTAWAQRKLARNLELNPGLDNVRVERLALSDRDAPAQACAFRAQWRVDGAVVDDERGHVDHVTLDRFCRERSIERLDFVKLDVDGHESKVLRGGRGILGRTRPTMIVELGDFWQRRAGDDLETLIALLDALGYAYRDERDLRPVSDLRAHVRRDDERATVNVVCVPR